MEPYSILSNSLTISNSTGTTKHKVSAFHHITKFAICDVAGEVFHSAVWSDDQSVFWQKFKRTFNSSRDNLGCLYIGVPKIYYTDMYLF